MIITLCCFVVFVVSIFVMLKASDLLDNVSDKKKKRKVIYRWVGVCSGIFAIVMMFLTLVGFMTADFQTDTKERTIIIADKWHEDGNYYFTDEHGNIYKMSYGWHSEYKYDDSPFKRHKDLAVNEKYIIEVLYTFRMEKYCYGRSINEVRKNE